MCFSRKSAAFVIFSLLVSCAPTITKHVRVQRHVDRKPTESFQWPVNNPQRLSKFGPRNGSYHTGLDVRGRKGGGDFAYASRSGRVMSVGWFKDYGKQIMIEHRDGYKTRYAHLKSVKVKLGQTVTARQAIGIIGKTGHATAPHLHFEIITPDGYFIDPELLLP